ncbi:hypothetical protein GQR58_000483 [Nymphon striatum]|nr:hypothetical protein GQR58_000483 [Nymphon striatum]
MSNVIKLNVPSRFNSAEDREAALLCSFAGHRRFGDDVFWLKENAEVLNVLESTGAQPTQAALEAHMPFYASVEKRLSFFPQYYRFLLSITLDLEELGVQGNKGDHLCEWISREGLPGAELSDLQRMEAKRLLARRGVDAFPNDKGLEDRMREFISRSATFSMPNKKAAYELTHTVFYLSEYGRKDPEAKRRSNCQLALCWSVGPT